MKPIHILIPLHGWSERHLIIEVQWPLPEWNGKECHIRDNILMAAMRADGDPAIQRMCYFVERVITTKNGDEMWEFGT